MPDKYYFELGLSRPSFRDEERILFTVDTFVDGSPSYDPGDLSYILWFRGMREVSTGENHITGGNLQFPQPGSQPTPGLNNVIYTLVADAGDDMPDITIDLILGGNPAGCYTMRAQLRDDGYFIPNHRLRVNIQLSE